MNETAKVSGTDNQPDHEDSRVRPERSPAVVSADQEDLDEDHIVRSIN